MSADFGIVCPPWHYADDAALLDRALGEVGLDHVTFHAVSGPRSQFCLFSGTSPYFHTEGGWHFPPESRAYVAASLKPRPARWCGQRDEMRRLVERVRDRGVKVCFRVNITAAPSVAEQAPDSVCRNAWGDAYADAPPCPSHPSIRELLAATIQDLRRYEPAAIEVVGLQLDARHWDMEFILATMHLGMSMEICFCPACRQIAADVCDPDLAARSVRATVEKYVSVAHPESDAEELNRALADDPVLQQYSRARAASAHRWLETLAPRFAGLTLILERCGAHPDRIGFRRPAGWKLIAPAVVGREELTETTRTIPDEPDAVSLALRFCRQSGAEALVRAVHEQVRLGARIIDFEDLEELPPAAVGWLRQAVRFARRESED
jgi:hypothetical protein